LELILGEPAADRPLAPGKPLHELLIGHQGKIDYGLLTGTAKAALPVGRHPIPAFGAGIIDAEAYGLLHVLHL
jgi:hypothetical protein